MRVMIVKHTYDAFAIKLYGLDFKLFEKIVLSGIHAIKTIGSWKIFS